MERLSIDEVIEHCKRNTKRWENSEKARVKAGGKPVDFETADMSDAVMKEYWEHRQVAEWLEQLKTYKDAEEQGLLFKLPITIGSIVYRINEYAENPLIPMGVISVEIKGLTNTFKEVKCKECIFGGEFTYRFSDIGKTLFLTKEDAEKFLAELVS